MKNNYVAAFLLATILMPALAFAQCLPGWSYIQPVTINNTLAQTLTDYQVKLIVNTATPIAAGHMNASGDDIRFSTAGCVNANYWIESGINTASTVIWVKVPTLTASANTTLNMYYGNPVATPVSNGDSVFLFFDDFNGSSLNTTKWTVQGNPSVNTQSAGVQNFAGNYNWEYMRSNTTWNSAVVVETREYCENVSAALVLGYAGTDNRFTFRESGSNLKGVTFDPDVSGGNAWHDTGYPGVEHSSSGYYEFSLDVDLVANTMTVNRFCNTTTSNCNTTSQSLNAATGTGFYVGFSSYASGYTEHVDWIKVRQFASQVPVVTVASEQQNISIATAALSVSSFCVGDISTVNFSANGTFVSGNVFTAELSDASGSFAAPTAIGTLTSNSSGPQTMSVLIPVASPAGSAYRIRVVSSTPVVTGSDNGSNLSINLRPAVTVTSPFSGICNGSSDTLTAGGAINYIWSSGPSGAQIVVNPTSTSTYAVYGTDANGCMDTANFTVVVNQNPVVFASAADGTLCEGESDSLMASGASTYTWSTSETTAAIEVTPTATTTYTVTGTDSNGCVNTSTVSVTVSSLPVLTILSAMDTLCSTDAATQLNATPAGGTWSGPGVTGSTLDPVAANIGVNIATYQYTDSLTGCSSSDSIAVYVDVCTGLALQSTSDENFSVFPNPNNGMFSVNWIGDGNATLEIFDAQGKVVEVRTVKSGIAEQISLVASGIYTVSITTSEGVRTVHRVIAGE